MLNIGVDIGGTKIAAGVVCGGNILKKITLPTYPDRGQGAIIADVVNICKQLLEEFPQVDYVGVGCPGVVDPINGIVIKAENLSFRDVSISQEVSELLKLPVHLGNDANCAALGEHLHGAAVGYKNSITITLGTGIGGGIILDNKIYTGPFFVAGEVGHQVIVVGGEACTCGQLGCWEAYASGTALQGTGGTLTKDFLNYLTVGIANLVNILQPEIVVIGGGVSQMGQPLLIGIKHHIKDKIFDERGLTKFVLAKLGNDAGIIGASLLGGV
ncbi:MAG: ROK family protein [Defluviitaleaceae bacterium]|nr:ROK family protein [Defluviitaleaceae bacterium]